MLWNVNEDRPTRTTTIHNAASTDGRCRPQDKNPRDGQWYENLTEQELLALLPRIVERSGPNVRVCRLRGCNPGIPEAAQRFVSR
jgi:hypothetical protein